MSFPSKKIAMKLENSFWKSNQSNLNGVVIGIRLRNELDHPYTNFEYPYQLVFNFYSSGYSYFADQTQLMGGIDREGIVNYQYGFEGTLLNENTIFWANDGSTWTRVIPKANRLNNQYDAKHIFMKDVNMTNYLNNKIDSAYSYQPGTQGL